MARKYTQEEAELKFAEKGFKLLDTYLNNHTKIKTRCHCGKIFYPQPNNVFNNLTTNCGHCSDPKIGDRFGSLTIINIKPHKSSGCSVKCKCDCCKETKWYKFSIIQKGNTRSCGHCTDPKIGDIFGSLVVIKIKPSYNGGCHIKCQCNCGKVTGWIRSHTITSGNTNSCGNCKLYRNGIPTSHIALKLQTTIEKILNTKCDHNKKIGKYCVDIVSEEHKIAIEYDGYYWHRIHRDTSKDDVKRDSYLLRNGYKILRIQSNGTDIPSEEEISKVLLNHFQHGTKKKTIKMKSWKKAEKKHKNANNTL